MDGSYLDRWASWSARWLVAGTVVTVGASSWLSDALLARFDVVASDRRGTEWSAPIRLFPDRVRTPIHTVLERSLCVDRQVNLYLVEVRVPGGHAC